MEADLDFLKEPYKSRFLALKEKFLKGTASEEYVNVKGHYYLGNTPNGKKECCLAGMMFFEFLKDKPEMLNINPTSRNIIGVIEDYYGVYRGAVERLNDQTFKWEYSFLKMLNNIHNHPYEVFQIGNFRPF